MTSNDLSVPSSCVRSTFHLLRPHKADGSNLLSGHLVFALPAIEEFIASLFTGILCHGFMPFTLPDCILVPIPKGNEDLTSSDIYRPVALAPTLSKTLQFYMYFLFVMLLCVLVTAYHLTSLTQMTS